MKTVGPGQPADWTGVAVFGAEASSRLFERVVKHGEEIEGIGGGMRLNEKEEDEQPVAIVVLADKTVLGFDKHEVKAARLAAQRTKQNLFDRAPLMDLVPGLKEAADRRITHFLDIIDDCEEALRSLHQ